MGELKSMSQDQASVTQYPAKLSALPEAWIEKIFSHMAAFYGSLFVDRWKDCDITAVKRIWAESLATFSDNPECFRLALKALMDERCLPPTLPEFVALCRKHYTRPMPSQLALSDMGAAAESYPTREEAQRRAAELRSRFPAMRRVIDVIGSDGQEAA